MTDYEFAYKAAIALNNTAIHLAQHGWYIEACETLQDAMKCSKLFCDGGHSVVLPSSMSREGCEQALQAARDRKRCLQSDASTLDSSIHRNRILLVSDKDDPHDTYDKLAQNRSLLCCVTIDPIDIFDLQDVDRLQVESTLIVYNFGVVYRCIANRPAVRSAFKGNNADRSVSSFDVFCASVRIFEMTRTVTMGHVDACTCNGTRSLNISPNLLLTAVLVLTNLHQMSVECYSLNEAQHYYRSELSNVLAMLSEREMFLASEGLQTSVAVAA